MATDFKPCSVDGCNGNAHRGALGRAGFCCPHYKKKNKYGDPLFSLSTSHGIPMKYFLEVVLTHNSDECLEWPYARNMQGYGNIWKDGKVRRVHRLVCEETDGPPPTPKHEAAHECGNGHMGCVNPRHLSWKTRSANQLDRAIHGTSNRGENSGKSRLSEEQVRYIKSVKGDIGNRRLAKMFGVHRATIMAIHQGKSWGWLTP